MAKNTKQLKEEIKEAVKGETGTLSSEVADKIIDATIDDQLKKADSAQVIGRDYEGNPIVSTANFTPNDNNLPWTYFPATKRKIDETVAAGTHVLKSDVLSDQEVAALPLPYVLINGILVKPVKTGLSPFDPLYPWDAENRSGYFEHPEGKCSLYKVNVNGRKMSLLLDDKSKVTFTQPDRVEFDYWRNSGTMSAEGFATLQNSEAHNCEFIGRNTLTNVVITDSLLNSSTFRADTINQGHDYRSSYSMYRRDESDFPSKKKEFAPRERHTFNGVKARHSTFTNALVTPGYYSKSQITDSSIEGSKWTNVKNSTVCNSRISGLSISIDKGNIHDSRFDVENTLLYGAFGSFGEQLNAVSAHLPNKFCLVRIPMPDQDWTFIRVSESDFDLFLYRSNGHRLRANATRDQIIEAVNAIMPESNYRGNPLVPNPLGDSIAQYVVDTIASRLQVINTLDSVTQMAQDLSRSYPDFDDIYQP